MELFDATFKQEIKKNKNDTYVCTKTALKETDIWRGTHGCEKPDMTC